MEYWKTLGSSSTQSVFRIYGSTEPNRPTFVPTAGVPRAWGALLAQRTSTAVPPEGGFKSAFRIASSSLDVSTAL